MAEISISENTIFLSGELRIESIEPVWVYFKQLIQKREDSSFIIDLSKTTDIDSAGVAFLDEIQEGTPWRRLRPFVLSQTTSR